MLPEKGVFAVHELGSHHAGCSKPAPLFAARLSHLTLSSGVKDWRETIADTFAGAEDFKVVGFGTFAAGTSRCLKEGTFVG